MRVFINSLPASHKIWADHQIAIGVLQQNDRKLWLKAQYLVKWYPNENLLHLFKSCLLKAWERDFRNFSKHYLYKWGRFSVGYQKEIYSTFRHIVLQFVIEHRLWSGDRSQIVCDASNQNWTYTKFSLVHNVTMDILEAVITITP